MAPCEFRGRFRLINHEHHLFANDLFPLATCTETQHCWDYSKEAKRQQVSKTKSPVNLSTSVIHISWKMCCKPQKNVISLSVGVDSKRGQSIHHPYFAFYKPKCCSHIDRSSSNFSQIEYLYVGMFIMDRICGLLTLPLIVHCTEAGPISQCRKKQFECVCVCMCSRELSQGRK